MQDAKIITSRSELQFQQSLSDTLGEIEEDLGIVKDVQFSTTAVSSIDAPDSPLEPWYSALIVYIPISKEN